MADASSPPAHGCFPCLWAPASPAQPRTASEQQDSAWGVGKHLPLLGRPPKVAAHPWPPLAGHRVPTPTHVPDSITDAASLGAVELRAASVRGAAHRYEGSTRQDQYAYRVSPDREWLVAAVCDGLGSKALSDLGAMHAAATSVRHVATRLQGVADPQELMRNALDEAAAELCAQAARLQAATDEMSTTISLMALHAFSGKCHLALLGDSPALRLSADGLAVVVDGTARVDDGECGVSSTATACLPGNLDLVRTHSFVVPPGEAVLLASDGFAEPALTGARKTYFWERWQAPPDCIDLLTQLNFLAKSYDDDRTVVSCWVTHASV